MNLLVPIVMYGWIPAILFLFKRFPAQRAVIMVFVAATLFLPEAVYLFPVVKDFDKVTATSYGALLATSMYYSGRFSTFKLSWLDLPMLIWCLSVIPSQITNDLSPVSPTIVQVMTWGVPYFLGRIYLSDLVGLRQLAIGVFAGGLLYVPLCLFEIRFSPNLHRLVYGFAAREDFSQTIRYGGYRPTVFMQHGLSVGLWMMAATLISFWLWRTGVIKKFWNMPISWLAAALLVTFVLDKSTGAYIYLVLGVIILFIGKQFRTALLLFLLVAAISTYLYMGVTGSLYTDPHVISFVASANESGDSDRSQSLAFRIQNEEILSEKARQKMIFGWGASGGNRVQDAEGKDLAVTDSLWIIAFGKQGVVGLVSFVASLLLPAVSLFVLRYPARSWSNPKVAPAVALAVVLVLYMLDSSLNAMISGVFPLACGGITGLVQKEPENKKVTGQRPTTKKRSLA